MAAEIEGGGPVAAPREGALGAAPGEPGLAAAVEQEHPRAVGGTGAVERQRQAVGVDPLHLAILPAI